MAAFVPGSHKVLRTNAQELAAWTLSIAHLTSAKNIDSVFAFGCATIFANKPLRVRLV